MISIPLLEACIAIGGRRNLQLPPLQYIHHVTQKSGDVNDGSLFVALRGEKVDGHSFVKDAENSGAIAAVVEYLVEDIKIPQFVVPSSKFALGTLARIWKGRLQIPTIAVTGSVGKTSTKDLIAHILDFKFSTHKSRENFNNELGVPIELLRLDNKHECSVIEFGMRDVNQINYLSKIARPTIGVITNIGMSHIETLKTRENIAIAKAEILQGMDYEGLLILNHDDDYYEFIKEQSHCNVISFGEHIESDIRISNIKLNERGNPSFHLNDLPICMSNCTGKHNAYNAAIGYLIGLKLGMPHDEICKKLDTYKTSKRRGVVSKAHNGALILDSTYNVAPDSLKSSLFTLAILADRGKKTIAVIGEMLELGSYSEEAHKYIGKVVSSLTDIDMLITVGKSAKYIGTESKLEKWKHCLDSIDVATFLLNYMNESHVILIQGSNEVSLDLVVQALEKGQLVYA